MREGAGEEESGGETAPASRGGGGLPPGVGRAGVTGELGWAAAGPGSWAGPVGGEGFFLNSDKQNKNK